MSASKPRMLFVNIPVSDLQRSMEFFKALGFSFNSQFTDHNAACMVLSEQGYFMLLTEPFFKGFTDLELPDRARYTGALFAISCESRAEVDEMVHKAIAAGGRHAKPATDHGFMYAWSFYDVDGHHWEVLWMDPSVPQQA